MRQEKIGVAGEICSFQRNSCQPLAISYQRSAISSSRNEEVAPIIECCDLTFALIGELNGSETQGIKYCQFLGGCDILYYIDADVWNSQQSADYVKVLDARATVWQIDPGDTERISHPFDHGQLFRLCATGRSEKGSINAFQAKISAEKN